MTRDEIERASGRELDALIAVNLFGWRYCDSFGGSPRYDCVLRDAKEASSFRLECVSETAIGKSPLEVKGYPPAYSADWAGLGLVVDEMRRRGWIFSAYDTDSLKDQPATVEFDKMERTENDGDGQLFNGAVEAEAFPVAACRAALLAILAEKQHDD